VAVYLSLRNMQLTDLKGPCMLGGKLRLYLLFLLLLLLPLLLPPSQLVTRAQTITSTSSAPTAPGTSSTPSLRERVRALMRDFPLVDGCVGTT
jgi:hypothetical protein